MSENTKTNLTDPATVRAAARHLYETSPLTFEQIGEEFGVADRTVKRWAEADGGWRKLVGPEITARAQEAADRIQSAVADITTEEDRQAVLTQVRVDAAINERANVLSRHRKEWSVVRALAGEAVRDRDGAKAKLALDVGRALDLAQRGEARAWGLDYADERQGAVIVIERS